MVFIISINTGHNSTFCLMSEQAKLAFVCSTCSSPLEARVSKTASNFGREFHCCINESCARQGFNGWRDEGPPSKVRSFPAKSATRASAARPDWAQKMDAQLAEILLFLKGSSASTQEAMDTQTALGNSTKQEEGGFRSHKRAKYAKEGDITPPPSPPKLYRQ